MESGFPSNLNHRAGKTVKAISLHAFLIRLVRLCVLPLLALAVYLSVNHIRELQVHIDRDAGDRVQNAATAIDSLLGAQIGALEQLAGSPFLDKEPPALKEFYREARAFHASFAGHIILADLSTQMLLNTRAPLGTALPRLPVPKGHAAAPTAIKTGEPAVGDMFLGPVAKEPLVAIALPVLREGRTRFILLSTIETRRLQERLDEIALPSGWSLTLLDGKGEVMARHSATKGEQTPAESRTGKRFTAHSSRSYWSMALNVSPSTYRAPLVTSAGALLAAVLCFTLISIMVGRATGQRLARSVESLVEAPSSGPSGPLITEVETVRAMLASAAEAKDAAEARRQESERRFRSTLDSMLEGCQIIGYDWRYSYINDAADIHNRRPKEELLGNRYTDMWPGVEATDVFSAIRRCMDERVPHHMENEFRFPDGTSGWFDLSIQPVPEGVFILSIDVTVRKQAEKDLIESEAKYRLIADNADDWIYWIDEEQHFRYVSPACERLTGYSPAEFVSHGPKLFHDMVHPEDREVIHYHLAAIQDESPPDYLEFRVITRSGGVRWISHSCAAVYTSDGRYAGRRGTNRNITERRLAEESARRQTERLQSLHEVDKAILLAIESPEAIARMALRHLRNLLSCDRAGVGIFDEEKREVRIFVEALNEGIAIQKERELEGAVYEELKTLRPGRTEVVNDIDGATPPPAASSILRAEGVRSFIRVPLAAGERLIGVLNLGWNEARSFTREEAEIADEVARQVAIALEQARLRKEAERHAADLEQRVQDRTAQLEAANKELEAFSYSVSHDLRAPLRHIRGYADLLTSRLPHALPDEGKRFLDRIVDSAREMGTLIDDILQFSRNARQEMRQGEVDMNGLLGEIIDEMKRDNPERIIEWVTPPLPSAFGDRALLRLVWLNLISNAVKFTRTRAEARIEIEARGEKTEQLFLVRDNGVGFDMRYGHKLFGVFQRLHPASQFEGTGIGLANVRRIIVRHGGRTWAEAEPGKGAIFYFTLPKLKGG